MEYVRNAEDIEKVVKHAKLDISEFRPLTQTLYFASKDSEYRILELNDSLYDTLVVKGENLIFKGDHDEKAVICTSEATYDVKAAETSNSLLLIPGLKFSDNMECKGERDIEEKRIVNIFNEYLEVKKCKPRVHKLKHLLEANPFTGLEEETSLRSSYSTKELLDCVQASEAELYEALRELDAFQLGGKWRILGVEYHFRTLSYLLNLIDENSWSTDMIPIGQTISMLKDLVPKVILDHILQAYLVPSGMTDDEGDELFTLKQDKTCCFIGEYLLRPVQKFNSDDFMQAWAESVPEGMNIDLKQLEGIALFRSDQRPPVFTYFPESELPENEVERFERLFTEKPSWNYNEIEPYVRKLATEKQTVNSLLTKHTRVSNINGVKVYSSRYRK
ncbi:sister chromatid cohesion protein DCC1 [Cimex lectularius]|uniref:Sister chromatid cohesion protein DCC1 n=1 Tax=Cimex lectularius TaxID=79782 RepID=A0A8I6TDU8_CIMLE|nr:sister chromatid cohesion protein DCC1 [Cimex lectularius]